MKSRDNVHIFGVNSRLDVLNAEVLNFRLKKLNSIILKRRKNALAYKKFLDPKYVQVPFDSKNQFSSFVIFLCLCEKRDELQRYLANNGIGTEIHYPKVAGTQYQYLKNNSASHNWSNASRISRTTLSLPMSPWLKNEEIEEIVSIIHLFK
jgi:dTDP-4-amino-4,6-dideoxygalactose transaminase